MFCSRLGGVKIGPPRRAKATSARAHLSCLRGSGGTKAIGTHVEVPDRASIRLSQDKLTVRSLRPAPQHPSAKRHHRRRLARLAGLLASLCRDAAIQFNRVVGGAQALEYALVTKLAGDDCKRIELLKLGKGG